MLENSEAMGDLLNGQTNGKKRANGDFSENEDSIDNNGNQQNKNNQDNFDEDADENEEDREKFESDLIFLGFVVFRNKLKRDTKHIISKLISSNLNLVMATGDNPFTSISVARECGLIERSKEIFFCDIGKENSEEHLELYNITMGGEHNIAPVLPNLNLIPDDLISKLKHSFKRGIIIII